MKTLNSGRLRAWRRKYADKLERIAELQEAHERANFSWADPLTDEWRDKVEMGERA